MNKNELVQALRAAFDSQYSSKKAPEELFARILEQLDGTEKPEQLEERVRAAFEQEQKKAPKNLWDSLAHRLDEDEQIQKKAPAGLWARIDSERHQEQDEQVMDAALRRAFEATMQAKAPAPLWLRIKKQLNIDLVWSRLEGHLERRVAKTLQGQSQLYKKLALLSLLLLLPLNLGDELQTWLGRASAPSGIASTPLANATASNKQVQTTFNSSSQKQATEPLWLSQRADELLLRARQKGKGTKATETTIEQTPTRRKYASQGQERKYKGQKEWETHKANREAKQLGQEPSLAQTLSTEPKDEPDIEQVLAVAALSPQALAEQTATLPKVEKLPNPQSAKQNRQNKLLKGMRIGAQMQLQRAFLINEETRAGFNPESLVRNNWKERLGASLVLEKELNKDISIESRLGYQSLAQGYSVFEQGRYIEKTVEVNYLRLQLGLKHRLPTGILGGYTELGAAFYAGYLLNKNLSHNQSQLELSSPEYRRMDYGLAWQALQNYEQGPWVFSIGLQAQQGLADILQDNRNVRKRTRLLDLGLFVQVKRSLGK